MSRETSILTKRRGRPPETGARPPHLQLTDVSPRSIHERMARWAFEELPTAVPFVRRHRTLISVPTSEALWLDESQPAAADGFMPPPGSREFAHLHADGSWHLVVEHSQVELILRAGWGERHPWFDRGVHEVLVYAPRDEDEIAVVKGLVIRAIVNASGHSLTPERCGLDRGIATAEAVTHQ